MNRAKKLRKVALAILGGLLAVWFVLARSGGDRRALRPLTALIGLIALQAAIGGIQWALELPALLVWFHIAVAVATWLTVLWTVAAAGRLEPRPQPEIESASRRREDEPVGTTA